MKLLTLSAFAIAVILCSACSREEPATTATAPAAEQPAVPAAPDEPAAEPEGPTDWDPAALAMAEELAEKVRAGGVACDEYEVIPYLAYIGDYRTALKMETAELPIAETYCSGGDEGDEDITFIVFASNELANKFVETKRSLLCRRAKKMKLLEFPGFPYVQGDKWIIQPDERTTSVQLGDILGVPAKMAACDFDQPEAPAT